MYRLTVLWLIIAAVSFVAGQLHGTRHNRITKAQLLELRAAARGSVERDDCRVALGEFSPRAGDSQRQARIRCAWLYRTTIARVQVWRAS